MLCARGTFEIQSHRQIGNEKVKTVALLHMIIHNEVGDKIGMKLEMVAWNK